MRFEIIALLSWLVREGYITSFHVTKDKIYVTIKKQPPLVVAGRLLSKIEVQANRLEVSPLLCFYYSTAFRESQQFFRKKFEARKRAFLFGTLIQSGSRKPGFNYRGDFGELPAENAERLYFQGVQSFFLFTIEPLTPSFVGSNPATPAIDTIYCVKDKEIDQYIVLFIL